MPRETQTEKNNNPTYYETICCETCGSAEQLRLHYHAKDILCVVCVNVLLAEAANADEFSGIRGREYDEDKADEDRLEYLLQEREA